MSKMPSDRDLDEAAAEVAARAALTAPTPETPRMTEDILCPACGHDIKEHHAGTVNTQGCRVWTTPEKTCRCYCERSPTDIAAILFYSTRRALAASQQEVEWLWESIGKRDGDLARARDEIEDLRASLALAQKDGERLDWLEAQEELPQMVLVYGAHRYTTADVEDRDSVRRNNHATLRDAIDAAMSSPPPETTQGETNGA